MNKIWKVVIIVLASVLGAVGVIFLGIYLSGDFEENLIYPQDIYFANVDTLSKRFNDPYYEYENFQLLISSATEEFNQDEVVLSFPTNQTNSVVKYLKEVQLSDVLVGDSISFYYAYDNEGNVLRFASCTQAQATYITNSIVIVPIKVTIDEAFDVLVCLAPNDLNGEVEVLDGEIETELYNIGGYSQIIARSANLNISSVSSYVYIDVPVEDFEIIGITGENISETNVLGLNEYELNYVVDGEEEYYEASTDSLFSVIFDLMPARAIYKYGKNGDVGAVEYKKVIFNINTDESFITFADESGNEIDEQITYAEEFTYNAGINLIDLFGADFVVSNFILSVSDWASEYSEIINSVYIDNGVVFVNIKNNEVNENFQIEIIAEPLDDELETLTKTIYGYDKSLKYYDNNFNGIVTKTTTLGVIFKARSNDGLSQVHAGIFKNSILENEALGLAGSSLTNLFTLMNNQDYGISKTTTINLREIAIDGFEVTDSYEGVGNELDLTVNYSAIIFANNPDSNHSLGIEVASSSYAQSRIRNILLSIQFEIGTEWFDATQINDIDDQIIYGLFNLDANNLVLTGEDLKIEEENPLYNFYFYRPQSSSNMSYWEVMATGRADEDSLQEYGITAIRISLYYLNPETGLVLDNSDYGPYNINTVVNPTQETILDWNHDDDLLTNEEIGAGSYNERVLIGQDIISLENIASISNLDLSPTYTTIRYFIYHVYDGVDILPNLDTIFNVTRYYGQINGVSGEDIAVYEIDSMADSLICNGLGDYLNLQFRLTFAVVENDIYGSPVTYNIGGNDVYSIVSSPLGETGETVLFAPISIEKSLGEQDISIVYDDTITISPYNLANEKFGEDYFLQGTQRGFYYYIAVTDADLFEKLVLEEAIVLSARYINDATACNDIYLYYETTVGGETYSHYVELADVLSTIIENKSAFDTAEIISVDINNGLTTYGIPLSIKDITFDEGEDEKEVVMDLTYTINANNIPDSYTNPRILSTNNFFIYSGKILNISFGDETGLITNGFDNYIYVEKSVDQNDFSTSIYRYLKVENKSTIYSFSSSYIFIKTGTYKILVDDVLYIVEVAEDYSATWYKPCTASIIAPESVNGSSTFGNVLTFANGSYTFIEAGKYNIVVDDGLSTEYFVEVIKNSSGNLVATWYETDATEPVIDATNVYEKTALSNLYDEDNYVSVILEDFGINDLYAISSSDSTVAQVVYISSDDKYSLNFLKSGTVTLTLTPVYANSDFQFVTLNFIIFSNYDLDAFFGSDLETDPVDVDQRIIDYGSLEYSVVGENNDTVINFSSLIKILASVEGSSVDVTLNKFLFNVTYDDNAGLIYTAENTTGKIEIVYTESKITGITIRNVIATNVTLVVSAISPELGAYFAFNINIIPFNRIIGTISDQAGAEKPANAEPDSVGVFAQANIDVVGYQYQQYSYLLNGYENTAFPSTLKYSLYSNKGQIIEGIGDFDVLGVEDDSLICTLADEGVLIFEQDGIFELLINIDSVWLKYRVVVTKVRELYVPVYYRIIEASITPTMTNVTLSNDLGQPIVILTFNNSILEDIKFADVVELSKFTLIINWADSSNDYDLSKTYIFYVLPNIQVDENSFENEELVDENGIINLNNQNNPIMNGDEITIDFDDTEEVIVISFGLTAIEINFNRISAGEKFDLDLLKVKVGELYTTDFTIDIANVKKLSEKSLIISYNGVDFEIIYYAAPKITLSSSANTVVFDGEDYVALYAAQNISNLRAWFLYNGSSSTSIEIRLGTLAVVSNIKNLQNLYALNGTVNLTEDSVSYTVTKNSYGLIQATIIVSYGTGLNREFVAVKALIFPIEWNYLEYENYYNYKPTNIESVEDFDVLSVEDFDVLNVEEDSLICTLEEGVLAFKQVGIFKLSIKIESVWLKYKVVVTKVGDTYIPVYYNLIEAFDVLNVEDNSLICTLTDGVLIFKQVGTFELSINIESVWSKYKVIVTKVGEVYVPVYYLETDELKDVDIVGIIDGDYRQEIDSGVEYQVSTSFISSKTSVSDKFESLVGSNIVSNLYLITEDGEIQKTSVLDSVYLGIVNGELMLVVQPLGENRSYRLEFIYQTIVEGVTATYTFNYYVDINQAQEIVVYYPYGQSGEEEGIEDFINYQNIYHSQFTNDTYTIDLNSALGNFNGKYVELYNHIDDDEIPIDQGDIIPTYNTLSFEIYAVYDYRDSPRTQITANLGNFITINNGIVTLINSTNNIVGYIIKVSTPNGAETYYKIMTEPNTSAKVVTADGTVDIYANGSVLQENLTTGTEITANDVIIINGPTQTVTGYNISKSFDLASLILGGTTYSTDIQFGLVDVNGNVLNADNGMMFINNGYVVVKTSANEQRAYLVVYTEKDGIIRKIEMVAESAYEIDYTQPTDAYGDSNINISTCLQILKDEIQVSDGLEFELTFNDNQSYITDISGSSFNVKPLKTQKTFNITIKVWGTGLGLDGQTPETTCVESISLVVQPNITVIEDASSSTEANLTFTGIDTNALFETISLGTGYRYDASVSWNGGTGETISINGESIGFEISSLTNTISLNISAVAATRTAIITVIIYNGPSLVEAVGDTFTSTYILTI
ncbi:MAG: hypothetical protein PHS54_03150, partial [Clostridia bacterium]|nr:hypothetical protein [Clostridia bacterium]